MLERQGRPWVAWLTSSFFGINAAVMLWLQGTLFPNLPGDLAVTLALGMAGGSAVYGIGASRVKVKEIERSTSIESSDAEQAD